MRSSSLAILLVFTIIFGIVRTDSHAQDDNLSSTTSTSIVFVIDTSGSMEGLRLTAVQDALYDFISNTPGVPTALVTFNDTVDLAQNYTVDMAAITAKVDTLSVEGMSALYEATTTAAVLAFQDTADQRIVVLVTDGTHTSEESTVARDEALQVMTSSGAQVFTIGLGEAADQNFLSALSEQTGGEMSYLMDAADIELALNKIQAGITPTTTTAVLPPGESAIVLAVTTSAALDDIFVQQAQALTQVFAEALEGEVPVTVLTFDEEATVAEISPVTAADLVQSVNTSGLPMSLVPPPAPRMAFYDHTLTALQAATEFDAANPMVILVSDGTAGEIENATPSDEVLNLAIENGIQVYTIGLNGETEEPYLEALAAGTEAEFYTVANIAELEAVYETFATSIVGIEQTTAEATIEPLDMTGAETPVLLEALVAEDGLPSIIRPLDTAFQLMNLNNEEQAAGSPESLEVSEAGQDVDPAALAIQTADEQLVTPDDLQTNEIEPFSPIIPVTIDVLEAESFGLVELFINGETLVRWDGPPYEYVLDTRMLTSGIYELEVAAETSSGGTFLDNIQFEVAVLAQPAAADAGTDQVQIPYSFFAPDQNAVREVLVDGEATPLLHMALSQAAGLTVYSPPQPEITVQAGQTLRDILASPIESLPAPVRAALTENHPITISILIVLMALVLLPQGIFTIYWMTYSWVNPERMARSGAPETHEKPYHSFTALIPARREESVLYDTIMAVHSIDYPEHLKEILVLIRDDDDDGTIAAAQRAITDIVNTSKDGWLAEKVRLITFKDGPKNKPNGLNRGYLESTHDVICIFDAEDQPNNEVYNVINTVMRRDGADVVQSGVQLMNFKSTWFSSFNVLEYFFWFKSGLHAFTHGLNVTPLGGNTVFFKKSWLDKLAAQDTELGYRVWDEASLTEDADIGIRLTSMGASIQIVYEARQATQEETPANVEQLIKQRTRWSQGFYEIFFKGDWRYLPKLKQRVGAIYILLNSVLQGSMVFFLPFGLFIWATQSIPVPFAILSWIPILMLFIQLMITLVGIREFTESYGLRLPFLFRLRMIIFYYPYQMLLSVSAMRAVVRFVTRQSNWEKTEHSNLHRPASTGNASSTVSAR